MILSLSLSLDGFLKSFPWVMLAFLNCMASLAYLYVVLQFTPEKQKYLARIEDKTAAGVGGRSGGRAGGQEESRRRAGGEQEESKKNYLTGRLEHTIAIILSC